MDYKTKIKEIVGDEAKADEIISSISEAFIDKDQYNRKVKELSKISAEREEYLAQLESSKVERMSAEEKLKHELEKLETTKRDYSKKMNLLEVKTMFVNKGINADEYSEIIENLVSHDAETTKKVASGVIDMIVKQTETAVSKAQEDLINKTPKPGATQKPDQQPLRKIRQI